MQVTLCGTDIAGMKHLPRDEHVKQAMRYFNHYPEQKPDYYDEWVQQEKWLQEENAAATFLEEQEEAQVAEALAESRRLKEEEDDAKSMSAAARAAATSRLEEQDKRTRGRFSVGGSSSSGGGAIWLPTRRDSAPSTAQRTRPRQRWSDNEGENERYHGEQRESRTVEMSWSDECAQLLLAYNIL